MNFFGHATIACWRSTRSEFVLGAMLPDFERMSRARPDRLETEIHEGVCWHHRTDAAFHACPTFVSMCGASRRQLRESGLPRGPAMAIAHIGIELLLDGLLLGDPLVEDAYLGALQVGHSLASSWAWSSHDEAARFAELLTRLVAAGVPAAYRDPDCVVERIHRILADRPRLAFPATLDAAVRLWARTSRDALAEQLPALFDELASSLQTWPRAALVHVPPKKPRKSRV